MSDLVGNPEDRLSHNEAHLLPGELNLPVGSEANVILHYENTPMQTAIFHCCKNDNFQLIFFTIFIFLLKT